MSESRTESTKVCVYCDRPAQGNFSIHRDGFGVGPEVPLCDECGDGYFPSCETIWERIREANRG